MTKCEYCGHEFHNFLLREDCPKCKNSLRRPSDTQTASSSETDEGFDAMGFMLGMATGVPLSPTHGISVGSMLGAAMHNSSASAQELPSSESHSTPAPDTSSSNSDSGSSDSSSYDSESSPSSYDSGSSGGGSSD